MGSHQDLSTARQTLSLSPPRHEINPDGFDFGAEGPEDDRRVGSAAVPLATDVPGDVAKSPSVSEIVPPVLGKRVGRLPRRLRDFVPQPVARGLRFVARELLTEPEEPAPPEPSPLPPPPPRRRIRVTGPRWRTDPNDFGTYHEYSDRPSFIPEDISLVLPTAQPRVYEQPRTEDEIEQDLKDAVRPFPNFSSFHFAQQYMKSSQKSMTDMKTMLNAATHPRVKQEELKAYHPESVKAALLSGSILPADIVSPTAGDPKASETVSSPRWLVRQITINIPLGTGSKGSVHSYPVESLIYRPLVSVLKSSLEDMSIQSRLHISPYRAFWKKPGSDAEPVQLWDEIYSSDAMNRAHEQLQQSAREPDCELERVVLALMFASDATHPTNFGQTKVWPLYMFYGNMSKYERSKPGFSSAQHVAYLPSVRFTLLDVLFSISADVKCVAPQQDTGLHSSHIRCEGREQ